MDDQSEPPQVIFFLGAGASVAADVPDTHSFVKKFIESMEDGIKKQTIEKIVKILTEWKKPDIDVELLLETLIKLDKKDEEPLLKLSEGEASNLDEYDQIELLIRDLKDFIKSKTIVSAEKIEYLEPILEFVEAYRPLDVISVNYDTCIEQFCNVFKLVYQDGFDVNWNPKTFATEHTDICLYKLHGSAIWYQSNRGGYIKLPIMTNENEIELITGEKAESLMLYPVQKWDYAEPFLELMVKIKHLLESKKYKILIVVGYSFRDDYIIRLLQDAARKNRDLHLIFIDPNAYQIYSEKLKYYNSEQTIPSSLYGRVVCLPYKFEKVFPHIRFLYVRYLGNGVGKEIQYKKEELSGGKPDWISCIKLFVNAEHCEKVESLLGRIDILDLESNWQLNLELSLKMAVNLSANNQKEWASKHFDKFYNCLHLILVERIDVSVLRDESVEINFNKYPDRIFINLKDLRGLIETLCKFCETRVSMITKISDELDVVNKMLRSLVKYLKTFKEGITLEEYINMRNEQITDLKIFKYNRQKLQEGYSEELHNVLASEIEKIEKGILAEILGSG
ncbi:MAG: SIR2 family protein [Halobacteriota archaeon]|nr:SIR2 family protein [Halobacteriota archaeon]